MERSSSVLRHSTKCLPQGNFIGTFSTIDLKRYCNIKFIFNNILLKISLISPKDRFYEQFGQTDSRVPKVRETVGKCAAIYISIESR